MKKVLIVSFSIVISFILFSAFFPKYFLIDYFLLKNGITMEYKNIKEHLFSIEIKKVKFYKDNKEILTANYIYSGLYPFGFYLNINCKRGVFVVKKSFLETDIYAKDFSLSCTNNDILTDGTLNTNLKLRKNGIFGELQLKRAILKNCLGLNICEFQKSNLIFNGQSFLIHIELTNNINAKGSGYIIINKEDILNSRLNGKILMFNKSFNIEGTVLKPALTED